jgi:hypothetical protein
VTNVIIDLYDSGVTGGHYVLDGGGGPALSSSRRTG